MQAPWFSSILVGWAVRTDIVQSNGTKRSTFTQILYLSTILRYFHLKMFILGGSLLNTEFWNTFLMSMTTANMSIDLCRVWVILIFINKMGNVNFEKCHEATYSSLSPILSKYNFLKVSNHCKAQWRWWQNIWANR